MLLRYTLYLVWDWHWYKTLIEIPHQPQHAPNIMGTMQASRALYYLIVCVFYSAYVYISCMACYTIALTLHILQNPHVTSKPINDVVNTITTGVILNVQAGYDWTTWDRQI